jgi:hypothetical protein
MDDLQIVNYEEMGLLGAFVSPQSFQYRHEYNAQRF